MKRSTDRILTTHAGSLPRPDDLVAMVEGKDQQQVQRNDVFDRRVQEAVRELVQKQIDAGIDFINDGEQSKSGFSYYIAPRLGGIVERDLKSGEQFLQMDASARDRALTD